MEEIIRNVQHLMIILCILVEESDNEFGSNVFNLYLMSTKSDYVRRLTTNGRNQFPKFSSNGESYTLY